MSNPGNGSHNIGASVDNQQIVKGYYDVSGNYINQKIEDKNNDIQDLHNVSMNSMGSNFLVTMPPKRITKRFSMPADHDFSEEQDVTLSHPVQVYLQEPVEEINNLPTREPHIPKQMKRSQQKNSKKCLMPQNFFELAVPTIKEEESPQPKRVRYTYSKDPEDYKETNDAGCHHLNENYQVSSNEFHYHSAYDEPLSVHVNNSEEEVRQLLPVQLLSHIKSTNKSDVLPKTTDSPDKSRMYRDCVEAACDLFKEETDQVFLKDLAHFKYMKKTSMPYSLYIGLVLSNIDTYAISVADIYKSIIFMFPHMEFEAEISWRSSIRHTIISKKNYFDKIAKLDATEKGVCNYRLKCAFDFTKHGLNEPAVVAEYKNSMRFPELFEKLIIGECKVFPPEDDRISRILEHIYEPVKIQNYFECRLRMKILISRIGTKSLCEPKNPTKKKTPKVKAPKNTKSMKEEIQLKYICPIDDDSYQQNVDLEDFKNEGDIYEHKNDLFIGNDYPIYEHFSHTLSDLSNETSRSPISDESNMDMNLNFNNDYEMNFPSEEENMLFNTDTNIFGEYSRGDSLKNIGDYLYDEY